MGRRVRKCIAEWGFPLLDLLQDLLYHLYNLFSPSFSDTLVKGEHHGPSARQ
jgi:hypothetical protein